MTEIAKRASWSELFYDLAFVALVAQLTYLAADHHKSLTDILNIFIIGYSIFLAWWATTANRNLQESEGGTDQLMLQVQMLGAFLMSITMPGVFAGDYIGYFAILAVMRLLQIGMMMRMYRKHPHTKPNTLNIIQGMSIAAGLWLFSAVLPSPFHFVVAGMALLLDVLTPLTRGKGNTVRLLNVSHLQERLGLFLMLVIGESMLVVALANTVVASSLVQPFYVLSGVVLMISLWWLYFYHLNQCGEGVRPKNLFLYLHAHGFLFGSIIVLAAGYKNILKHGAPMGVDFWLVSAGLVGMYVASVCIRNALHGRLRRFTYVVGIALVVQLGISGLGILYPAWQGSMIGFSTVLFVLVTIIDVRRFVYRSTR